MKRILFLVVVLIELLFSGQRKIIILHTTDVHGNIYPCNYFTDSQDNNGLAKVYTVVKRFRIENPDVLLIDSGDLIQGTPLIYYFNHIDKTRPNPMVFIMNYMRYDAFAVGNHDIEQGYHVYYKAREESHFPWLSANGLLADGTSFFEPYTIVERNGIKIGIIGLTTPGIPMWLDSSLYPGITWEDMINTARKFVSELRPKVDLLIGLFHAGMNADYSSQHTDVLGLPNENASRLVAEQVPGFDAIFCGHSHGFYPRTGDSRKINNTVMLMSGSHVRFAGVASFDLKQNQNKSWQVSSDTSYILSMDTVTAAPEILTIAAPYHEQTLKYIRENIGTAVDSISAFQARWQDTPLIELINRAQLAATGAEISFAASFNDNFRLAPGPVQIKDVYGMYQYENYLYTIEMTGKQIKDYLEFSAKYYRVGADGSVKANPEMAGYNYDMAEEINYEIDFAKKEGQRIVNLINSKSGKSLEMNQTFRVALNSYRASGGGGHLAAAGIKTAKILWKSNEEMRNILIDYIRSKGKIGEKADNNWRLKK